MSTQEPVQRIAIVGTGTIGASWATHYLAQGFDVTATDPAPGAEAALRSYVEGAWEGVTKLGLAPGASPDRLKFTSDMTQALADAERVHILQTLERFGRNHSGAAEALGIGRTTLWRKLKEYGIDR